MNTAQTIALTLLASLFESVRQLTPAYVTQMGGQGIQTVSNYTIADSSAIVLFDLPDFPPIEIKKSGRFALPTIRSYNESGTPNNKPYPNGVSAQDAALWGDKHVAKQNGIRIRKDAAQVTPAQPKVTPQQTVIAQAAALATV